MSKSGNAVPRESGSQSLGKNHDRPAHPEGPRHNTKKHELPAHPAGLHLTGKPVVHAESDTQHSGRQHPPATHLADEKALVNNAYSGKLRKSDEAKGKK